MKEDETTSVFLLEDLVKEYNHKICKPPNSFRKKPIPLTLRPLEETLPIRSLRLPLKKEPDYPIIRAMTQEEIDSMRRQELYGSDWALLKSVLKDQASPKGLVSNVPAIAQGATLLEVVKELGLKGKVYHKSVGDKTYVILKGLAGERNVLKGTRYLNTNPQMVQFGLSKVTTRAMFKSGIKTSVLIYSGIKAVEAVGILMEGGDFEMSFWSEIGIDIPKIVITSAVTAAAGGMMAAAGVPVAVGVGVVLVVGFVASVVLEVIDRRNGWTQKFNAAIEKAWNELKSYLNSATSHAKVNDWDPQHGLVFGGGHPCNEVVLRKGIGNYLVYAT